MKKIIIFLFLISGFFVHAVNINYSTTAPTNTDVIATLTGENITTFLNGQTYTFTGNGIYVFEYLYIESGITLTGYATGIVNNIDKTPPLGTITYSTTGFTNQNVTGIISFNEPNVTITNNSGSSIYVFTGNGSFTFYFHDAAGNTGSATANVYRITGSTTSFTGSNTGTSNTSTTSSTGSNTGGTITNTPIIQNILPILTTGINNDEKVSIKDTCPLGDKSGNFEDGKCYAIRTGDIKGSKYSEEINNAYLFAYSKGLIDEKSIKNANIKNLITRKQFAKIIALFAMNVLDKKPDTSFDCSFTDTKKENIQTQNAIKLTCQLKIMGIDKNGNPNKKFNPNGNITRAQFGTILSRLLRGSKYDKDSKEYYQNHLQALKDAGIINKIEKFDLKEKKGNILLMLMRAAEYTNNSK